MSYLKDKVVYLAGPIHAVTDDGIGWRDSITPELKKFGLIVDDPCKKTVNGSGEVTDDKKKFKELIKQGKIQECKEAFFPIVRKDLRAVDKSDFLIVVYDPTIHMCGTIAEIILAHQQRKPLIMFVDPTKVQEINPWILTYIKASWLHTGWDSVINYLTQIDNGNFDTSYWTL